MAENLWITLVLALDACFFGLGLVTITLMVIGLAGESKP